MAPSEATCWTEIRGAAEGDRPSRERFAARYDPVIRSYLGARWRLPDDAAEVDDAAQDVFVECLRTDGPLRRADPERAGGFRAFLYGITLSFTGGATEKDLVRKAGAIARELTAAIRGAGKPLW